MKNICEMAICTGIGEIQFIENLLVDIPHDERLDYIEQNAERLRDVYCSEVCPVVKFRRKYEAVGM